MTFHLICIISPIKKKKNIETVSKWQFQFKFAEFAVLHQPFHPRRLASSRPTRPKPACCGEHLAALRRANAARAG